MHKTNTKKSLSCIVYLIFLLELFSLFFYLKNKEFGWAVFLVIIIPVFLLNKEFIFFTNSKISDRKFHVRELIWLFFLSVFIYFSLFIKPYGVGKSSYIAFVGYIALIFVAVYVIQGKLDKISWSVSSGKKQSIFSLVLYVLFPLAVYTVMFLSVFPGIFANDSIYVWEMISQGQYNNLHPLLYVLLNKALTLIWNNPSVFIAGQIIFASAVYGYIAFRFEEMGLKRIYVWIILAVITLIPANIFNVLTFWKDAPYTIALTGLMAELVRAFAVKDYFEKKSNYILLGAFSFIACISRHNGIVTVLLTLILLVLVLFFRKQKKHALKVVITLAGTAMLFAGLFYTSSALLKDKYNDKILDSAIYGYRLQTMIAIYNDQWGDLDDIDNETVAKYLNLEFVDEYIDEYKANSLWRFRGKSQYTGNIDEIQKDSALFRERYWRLAMNRPKDVLASYFRMTGIIWCSQSYGYTSFSALGIFKIDGLKSLKISFLKPLRELLNYLHLNSLSGWKVVFARPAFPLLIILILLGIGYRRYKWGAIAIAAPVLFNILGYLVIMEAQDSRYFFINFSAAVIFTVFALSRPAQESRRRDTRSKIVEHV